MFNVAFIGRQINSQSQQLNSSDVGMREQNQFNHIIHTIRVCQSIPYRCLGRHQIQDIQCGHSIGGVLGQEMDEFGDQSCVLDGLACSFVEGEVVVDHEGEIEKNFVVAGEESLQFLYYAHCQLHKTINTIWSLYYAMTDSLRRKPSVTMSRWKSFLSRHRIRICTKPAFLIFFYIAGLALMLKRMLRQMKNSLSCFQMSTLSIFNFFLALTRSSSLFFLHISMYSL